MRTIIVSILLAGVAASAVATDASARPRRARTVIVDSSDITSLPLTVNRRSWLDPGTAVSSHGAGPAYVSANTITNRTQDRLIAPDGFGNAVIQGPPYVPGRSAPVVEFSSLPNGDAVVDNVPIASQNYYFHPTPPEFPPASPIFPTGEPYVR